MYSLPQSGTLFPTGHDPREPAQAAALLVRFSGFLPHSGRALDVACGYGQNTLYLARKGLSTTGIDRSMVSLAAGREAAVRANLNASFVQADLRCFALPEITFSVVICFKYHDCALYPSIRAALRPGGLLIYETYTSEHRNFALKPSNPAHFLERNELLNVFGNWEIIFYHEAWIGRGVASLVARKPLSSGKC
jgi:tellurite methyltransferase